MRRSFLSPPHWHSINVLNEPSLGMIQALSPTDSVVTGQFSTCMAPSNASEKQYNARRVKTTLMVSICSPLLSALAW